MNAPVTQHEALSINLIPSPDLMGAIRQHSGAVEIAKAYEIDSPNMAQEAANERNNFLKAIDALNKTRKGFIEPGEQIIARAKALFDPAINSLKEGVNLLNAGLAEWDRKEKARVALENQQREEEARKARQEAERKAAEERARADEKARAQQRKAQEAEEARQKAIADGDARAAAAAAAAAAKATENAKAAIEEGAAKATEAHLAAAAVATAAAPVEQPTIAGNQFRTNWAYRLQKGVTEDQAKAQIVAACAARPELLALLKLDNAAIGKTAKAFKQAFNVPGYESFEDTVVAGSKK